MKVFNHVLNFFKKKPDVNDARVKFVIGNFIQENFKYDNLGVHEIKVKTKTTYVDIMIKLSRPGMLIGKKGCTIRQLKYDLKKTLSKDTHILIKDFDPFVPQR